MSTIEEAREQARKALSEDGLFNREQSTIVRALLDATEPPSEDMGPAASCHLCVGAGGYEDYDGGWVGCSCQRTREPMRDADGDMISSGEHRKISMSGDSFFVCDTCTNVLGLNVRWDHASKREDHQAAVESPPDKPAEDEREALIERIAGTIAVPWLVSHGTTWGDLVQRSRDPYMRDAREVLRVVEAAGYSKGPRPITDEDEREALVNVIRLFFQNWRAIGRVSPSLEMSIDSLEGAVDDLIELDAPKDCDYHEGFEEGIKVGRAGSGPRPITDEMVEAAAREYHERGNGEGSFARMSGHVRTSLLFRMKCALRAAEEARR